MWVLSSGLKHLAIQFESGKGILAIWADAALRALLRDEKRRVILSGSCHHSPPCFVPDSIPQSRLVNRTPFPGAVLRPDALTNFTAVSLNAFATYPGLSEPLQFKATI